ncbi:PPE family protein [Mycobacterium camsae]|uniref:PPE family protein n=1 Tax=Mycobacterium gordonae TaxID=1778 RepID=UPI0019810CAA|nr:PPE family protein [Mycobacterium gordonae]
MSFFTLPPEINSLRMFLGAGSAPMLQAAAAWDGLAAELGTAAQSFGSVISNLAGQAWQGPAAAAMAAAAAPYAGWLAAAAAQSQGAAGQALAVVSAFEAAQAATIHPGAVDANRNAFVQLVMTNLFGQNAPAIALAESIYEEMWAADVTAMAGYYSGAAAAAAQVVPWSSVLQSFPALAGGIAGGLSGLAGGATGAGSGAAGGGAVSTAGGAPPPTTGSEAAAAAGGGGGGGMAGADPGLAPAGYTGGDAGAYTGGTAAGTDVGSAAATSANTGVASPGVGGFGMMPMPMPMGGTTRSAGLLGDGPSMPVPAKAEEKDEEAVATEEAAEEATQDAEVTAEAPEAELPAMSVLPTAAPGIAAAAAPGAAKQASKTAGASRIPSSGFRASDAAAEEAEEAVATLRPKIAPGEFRPRAEEEEEAKIQIPGG